MKSGFRLWQLPTHTDDVMNSYIIATKNGKVIVIDGGIGFESDFLYNTLRKKFGNHVDAWFISHPHHDHMGALTEILSQEKYKLLIIDRIYGSLPAVGDVSKYELPSLNPYLKFKKALSDSNHELIELQLGELIIIDSVFFKILGIKNPEITESFINNSSVVMKVFSENESVLFLGDLGVQGGNKIMKNQYENLASEYVQMAHHGNYGVSEEFYIAVNPKYCLWPTPRWLWDNDIGNGIRNSGSFQILTVRGWMEKIGVKKHYVMKDGFLEIIINQSEIETY